MSSYLRFLDMRATVSICSYRPQQTAYCVDSRCATSRARPTAHDLATSRRAAWGIAHRVTRQHPVFSPPSFILFLKPYIGPMFSFLPSCSNLNLLVFLYTWTECNTNNQRARQLVSTSARTHYFPSQDRTGES